MPERKLLLQDIFTDPIREYLTIIPLASGYRELAYSGIPLPENFPPFWLNRALEVSWLLDMKAEDLSSAQLLRASGLMPIICNMAQRIGSLSPDGIYIPQEIISKSRHAALTMFNGETSKVVHIPEEKRAGIFSPEEIEQYKDGDFVNYVKENINDPERQKAVVYAARHLCDLSGVLLALYTGQHRVLDIAFRQGSERFAPILLAHIADLEASSSLRPNQETTDLSLIGRLIYSIQRAEGIVEEPVELDYEEREISTYSEALNYLYELYFTLINYDVLSKAPEKIREMIDPYKKALIVKGMLEPEIASAAGIPGLSELLTSRGYSSCVRYLDSRYVEGSFKSIGGAFLEDGGGSYQEQLESPGTGGMNTSEADYLHQLMIIKSQSYGERLPTKVQELAEVIEDLFRFRLYIPDEHYNELIGSLFAGAGFGSVYFYDSARREVERMHKVTQTDLKEGFFDPLHNIRRGLKTGFAVFYIYLPLEIDPYGQVSVEVALVPQSQRETLHGRRSAYVRSKAVGSSH